MLEKDKILLYYICVDEITGRKPGILKDISGRVYS
jgi:hypothetical protein